MQHIPNEEINDFLIWSKWSFYAFAMVAIRLWSRMHPSFSNAWWIGFIESEAKDSLDCEHDICIRTNKPLEFLFESPRHWQNHLHRQPMHQLQSANIRRRHLYSIVTHNISIHIWIFFAICKLYELIIFQCSLLHLIKKWIFESQNAKDRYAMSLHCDCIRSYWLGIWSSAPL